MNIVKRLIVCVSYIVVAIRVNQSFEFSGIDFSLCVTNLFLILFNLHTYPPDFKFRTSCQDHIAGENAVKCLSQGHNRMARVGFEPRPCRITIPAL